MKSLAEAANSLALYLTTLPSVIGVGMTATGLLVYATKQDQIPTEWEKYPVELRVTRRPRPTGVR